MHEFDAKLELTRLPKYVHESDTKTKLMRLSDKINIFMSFF